MRKKLIIPVMIFVMLAGGCSSFTNNKDSVGTKAGNTGDTGEFGESRTVVWDEELKVEGAGSVRFETQIELPEGNTMKIYNGSLWKSTKDSRKEFIEKHKGNSEVYYDDIYHNSKYVLEDYLAYLKELREMYRESPTFTEDYNMTEEECIAEIQKTEKALETATDEFTLEKVSSYDGNEYKFIDGDTEYRLCFGTNGYVYNRISQLSDFLTETTYSKNVQINYFMGEEIKDAEQEITYIDKIKENYLLGDMKVDKVYNLEWRCSDPEEDAEGSPGEEFDGEINGSYAKLTVSLDGYSVVEYNNLYGLFGGIDDMSGTLAVADGTIIDVTVGTIPFFDMAESVKLLDFEKIKLAIKNHVKENSDYYFSSTSMFYVEEMKLVYYYIEAENGEEGCFIPCYLARSASKGDVLINAIDGSIIQSPITSK